MLVLKVSKSDVLTVLKTGRNIVVVPVLIEGATVMGVFLTIDIFCVEPVVEWDNSLTAEGCACFTSCRNVVVALSGNSLSSFSRFFWESVFYQCKEWCLIDCIISIINLNSDAEYI